MTDDIEKRLAYFAGRNTFYEGTDDMLDAHGNCIPGGARDEIVFLRSQVRELQAQLTQADEDLANTQIELQAEEDNTNDSVRLIAELRERLAQVEAERGKLKQERTYWEATATECAHNFWRLTEERNKLRAELAEAKRSKSFWTEEARRYAGNADHHAEKRQQLRKQLAIAREALEFSAYALGKLISDREHGWADNGTWRDAQVAHDDARKALAQIDKPAGETLEGESEAKVVGKPPGADKPDSPSTCEACAGAGAKSVALNYEGDECVYRCNKCNGTGEVG